MNKLLILLVIVTLVACSGSGRYLQVFPGRRNSFNFACGGFDANNNPLLYNQRYSYNFAGLPSWLSQSGSVISGLAPANFNGPLNFNVRYTAPGGRASQSPFTSFTLVSGGSGSGSGSGSGGNYYTFLNSILNGNSLSSGSSGNAVVFFPLRTGLRAGSAGYITVIRVGGGGQVQTSGGRQILVSGGNSNLFALIQQCVQLQNAYYQAQQAFARAEQNRVALQGQLTAALIRLQLIQRSLATSVQAANENLRKQIAAIRSQIDIINGQLQSAQADASGKSQAVAQAQSELDAAQQSLSQAQSNANAVAQARQAVQAAQGRYEQAQQNTQSANQNLANAQQQASQASGQLASLNQAVSRAQARINELQAQLRQAQGELESANGQLANWKAQSSQNSVQQAQQAVNQATQAEAQARGQLENANAALAQASSAGDTAAAEAAVNAAQSKLKQAQDIAAQAQRIFTTLQGQLSTLNSQYQALSGSQGGQAQSQQIAASRAELQAAQATYAKIQASLSAASSQSSAARAAATRSYAALGQCQGGFVVSGSCGVSGGVRTGSGSASQIGSNWFNVGRQPIYYNSCTKWNLRSGAKRVNANDQVEWKGVEQNGKIWATEVKSK